MRPSGATRGRGNRRLGAGNHYLQVQAIDAAGNRGNKTSPLLVVK